MTITISDKQTHATVGYAYGTSNDQLVITSTGALIGQQGEGIENFGDNNSIDNSGYLFGGTYGIELDGVGDTVTNQKSGVISGASGGIFTFGGNSIVNHGTITGFDGVDIHGNAAGSLSNDGTISGSVAVHVNAMAGVTVSNGGTLIGWQYGIQVESAGGTVHNTGTIDGDVVFNSGTNVFDGNGGTLNGSITGGTGNDSFDLSHQTVSGTITAGAGADTVLGTGGNDTIYGNGGADILSGNLGNDRLIGGSGADTLTGNSGADTFVYTLITDSTPASPDFITDFLSGGDTIDLSALHTSASDKLIIVSNGGFTYVEVDQGGNGSIDEMIKVAGTNAVKTTDVLWANAAFPASVPHAAAPTPAIAAHHDHATGFHAVAVDHGLYG